MWSTLESLSLVLGWTLSLARFQDIFMFSVKPKLTVVGRSRDRLGPTHKYHNILKLPGSGFIRNY